MIKRIRFATRAADVDHASFPAAWRVAAGDASKAPDGVRPERIAVNPCFPELTVDSPHDGVGIEWFADEAHLQRFEAWLGSDQGQAATARLAGVLSLPDSPVLLADEVVLRGAEWLAERWKDGGDRLKHMAFARRAAGLTPVEFSERWRSRAGTVGSAAGPTVVIPDEARGRAYVQNHPRPAPAGAWRYDALNEVYFDDVPSLQTRIEWFAANLTGGAEGDLVSESWLVAAREEVVWDAGSLSE